MMRLGLLAFAIAAAPAQEPPRAPAKAAAPAELAATVQFAPGADLVGPWQAYSVELASLATRDLDLLIRIEDVGLSSVALRREYLPAGARKRVFLYGPGSIFPRGVPPQFRISDASDRQLQAGLVPITPRGYVSNRYQVGLFCRIAAAEDDFGLPSTHNGVEVRYARIAPDTLPDRWIGLAGLDLILLHDAPLDEITTDQARALADYVRQGGTILASPGATKGWLAHPVLGAIATIRAAEPKTVDAVPGLSRAFPPAVRKEPFLVHPLLNGEPFKPGLEGELVRFPCGFGRILVAGADLRRAPFDTWMGRRKLWRDVLTDTPRWYLEDRAGFPTAATARQRFEVFHQMARLINPYPSFLLILGLAMLFLAMVGPLNYILLWRLRRTILLVITVTSI